MRTTVFKSGGSQAVKIPKEFRFDAKNVEIERPDSSLILTSNKWPEGYIESIRANPVDVSFIRHPLGEQREINL